MKKIIIIPFLFFALICQGNTYYVKKTGNNGNLGTKASPWLTLTYAETNMSGGDTCYIYSGTYTERLYISGIDGNNAESTAFIAYPGEAVIVDGTGIVLTAGSYLIQIPDDYILIDSIVVRNVSMNSESSYGNGIGLVGHNNRINDCIVHDIWQGGILLMGDSSIVEYCEVYNCAMSNSDGIYTPPEIWGGGIYQGRKSVGDITQYPIERHCIVHDIWGEGMDAGKANHAVIEDNIIYDCYSVHLYVMNTTNAIIQRNLIYDTKNMGDGSQAGIAYWDESWFGENFNSNNTIINNIIHGCGINLRTGYGGLKNVVIAHNTFVNSTEYGCIFIRGDYTATSTIIANNIIIQEDALPCIYPYTANSNIVWSNNLWNKSHDADATGAGDVIDVAHFTDSATYDYTLKASSPARNAGMDIVIYYDYLNNLRDPVPDIGAYEFESAEPPVLPTVITGSVWKWVRGAIATNNLLNTGGGTIIVKGTCWGTSANPNILGNHTHDGIDSLYYNSTITGLTKSTTYHYRAYATNEDGTAYGQDLTFTTPDYTNVFQNKKYVSSGGKAVIIK